MRLRAWMFCRARFSATLPPCTLKRGVAPVIWWKTEWKACVMGSIVASMKCEPIASLSTRARLRVASLELEEPMSDDL